MSWTCGNWRFGTGIDLKSNWQFLLQNDWLDSWKMQKAKWQSKLSCSACWESLITTSVGPEISAAFFFLFTVLSSPQHFAHLNWFNLAVKSFSKLSFCWSAHLQICWETKAQRPAILPPVLYSGTRMTLFSATGQI